MEQYGWRLGKRTLFSLDEETGYRQVNRPLITIHPVTPIKFLG